MTLYQDISAAVLATRTEIATTTRITIAHDIFIIICLQWMEIMALMSEVQWLDFLRAPRRKPVIILLQVI